MFIQTEETPNPETLKFMPGKPVLEAGTLDFPNKETCDASPLATALFTVDGVEKVFFGKDFISITKNPSQEWHVIKPEILAIIMEHFVAGKAVLKDPTSALPPSTNGEEEDDEVVAQIKELIETHVRPAVAMDGGDITFQSFEDGIVYLQLKGACAGCPSSTQTLKDGIENMLKHYVPEVVSVQAIE